MCVCVAPAPAVVPALCGVCARCCQKLCNVFCNLLCHGANIIAGTALGQFAEPPSAPRSIIARVRGCHEEQWPSRGGNSKQGSHVRPRVVMRCGGGGGGSLVGALTFHGVTK